MWLVRRVLAGDQERVFVIRQGRFERILGPGAYWIPAIPGPVRLEVHNIGEISLGGTWGDYLVKERSAEAQAFFTIVETRDTEVAVVSFDGSVAKLIGPGKRCLFWRGPVEVTAQVIDASREPEVPSALLAAVRRLGREMQATVAVVDEGKTGLVTVENRFVRTLGPGTYAFWNAAVSVRVDMVELRLQTVEIPGQEILTKDKVSIRVNVWAEFQVTDAAQAVRSVTDYNGHLYRTLQLAVRQTLGRRTLEEILAEKVDIDASVAAAVRAEMETFGVRVGAIALKDIVLPGEMREILNQVVTAEKQAQANLIRRREETAATRSLLNTAKLMEENPLLVRMKELETLEKIADKVDKITLVGGVDSLLNDLVKMK